MIFFYLEKPTTRTERIEIPKKVADNFLKSVSSKTIQIISWNEVDCDKKSITTLSELETLVIEIAKGDAVCKEMNLKACNDYGIYLFKPDGVSEEDIAKCVDTSATIKRTFFEWAHPMIGNIFTSPVVRPQILQGQYTANWNQFNNSMDSTSKEKIRLLMGLDAEGKPIPSPAKMADLTRSSHDQVRICPDMITLARAVTGEITTLATRRIEKLFALDLCRSGGLYAAQQALIKALLKKIDENSKAKDNKKTSLQAAFMKPDNPLKTTEYIKFYFIDCITIEKEKQWSFYVALIEKAVGEIGLEGLARGVSFDEDMKDEKIKAWLPEWERLPPAIRCAVVLNSFRRFLRDDYEKMKLVEYKYSMQYDAVLKKYSYIKAAGKKFLPQFADEGLSMAWSWNRDEAYPSTITYRTHLLPLWGGPSGHSHGHLDFALTCLGAKTIKVVDKDVNVCAIVLSSLFPLWRLYYDKRISAIHTIAETYEASIAGQMAVLGSTGLNGIAPPDAPQTPVGLTGDFSDAFNLVVTCQKKDDGVIGSIRLMNTLKVYYYDSLTGATPKLKYEALAKALNDKRNELTKAYQLPRWSKPIVSNPTITTTALNQLVKDEVERDEALRTIKIFSLRNVRVYTTPKVSPKDFRRYIRAKAESGKAISDLYERLKQQDGMVTLSADSLGTADIPAVWERTVLTNKIVIQNAVISALSDNQFTVSGASSFLTFGALNVCTRFSADFSGNLHICMETSDTIKSFVLKESYTELPKTIDGVEVLSAVTLYHLESIQLTDTGLYFSAEMDVSEEFWSSAKAIAELGDRITAQCQITANQAAAQFLAEAPINCRFSITDSFGVGLNAITLKSGLKAADSIAPEFVFECFIDEMKTTLSMGVDSSILRIHGEFDGQKVLTLLEISELFGLSDEISFLPADLSEAIFGSLGILEISILLNINPVYVENIDFVVSAEKPWVILSDKITLKPFLCVSVDNPFDTEKWDVDLRIDGTWELGSTTFLTSVAPVSGYISAEMQEGEVLDLSAAMQSFMGDLTLPEVSINGMRLFADYKADSYEIFLSAGKCLEFDISGIKIGIEDLVFLLEYSNHALGQFQLGGTLVLGGITFTVQGKYGSDSDWEFSASGLTDLQVNFSELLTKFSADIPSLSDFAAVIPEDFFSFKIGTIETSYRMQTKLFRLYVVLEKIFITEHFIIDSLISEIIVGAERLEKLNLRASFTVVGVSLLLDISKERDGFKISGGTESGQQIAIVTMLSDFVNTVLEYPVSLPAMLQSFTINQIGFSYASAAPKAAFGFDCVVAFGGDDSVLKNIFSAETHINITAVKNQTEWKYGFNIACEIVISGTQILTARYIYDTTKPESQNSISLRYRAKDKADVITLADILVQLGLDYLDDTCKFITKIGISEAEIAYDFSLNRLSGMLKLSSGGSFEVSLTNGARLKYRLAASSTTVISLSDVPIVGGLTDKFLPKDDLFAVKNLVFYALSDPDVKNNIPAGVRLNFTIFNENQKWQIYEIKPDKKNQLAASSSEPKILWMKLEKTLAIFTLHRLGLGLDGSYLMLVLDASLNVSPLTFTIFGAGIGVNISDFALRFYISGFGAAFKNNVISIAGEFKKSGKKYSGLLLIQVKQIAIFAIAEYSEDGNLFAYAVLSAPLGGLPEIFITGIALGFGYNKRIDMPSVDKIPNFPLIKGAMGKIDASGMLAELDKVLHDEKGQKFLSAGIKFTTYEIMQSFVLLTVSFGNHFEIDLLGLSDVTMPPMCPENVSPLAHAQLALKATLNPSEGFVGVEARLTSESYILSKNCHLTGGFALYMWYGGAHRGDFVLTLGGYHPKYALHKPAHYPDVPAVGFNWNIGDCVKVSGGIYFALTPSTLMAGGRLAMTYESGPLKAHFTAKADFFISWKPFHYDIEAGITLCGSYRANLWAVSFTISIELGVNLHIWGPDFSATAHLSFWIVSFDISFGADASKKAADLEWNEFRESFLPKGTAPKMMSGNSDAAGEPVAPITVSFADGLNGEITVDGKKMKSVRSNGVILSAETIMPISSARLNNDTLPLTAADVSVRPMGEKAKTFSADYIVTVTDENGICTNFGGTVLTKNMPSALWGTKTYTGELVPDVPCGITMASIEPDVKTFPEKQFISLDDLYKKGATIISNAFVYMVPAAFSSYTSENSISIFSATANSSGTSKAREDFLSSLGVTLTQKISLEKYASEAERYFDEEVMIPTV